MVILTTAITATIVWLLMYIPYWLWLRNSTFHSLQRLYLLMSLIAGIIVGLEKTLISKFFNYSDVIKSNAEWLNVNILSNINASIEPIELNFTSLNTGILFGVYFMVCTCIAGIFSYRLLEVILALRSGLSYYKNGVHVVVSPLFPTPFTFLNRVFFNRKLTISESSDRAILIHEKEHIRQKHTLDLLLVEVLFIFTWFCPIVLWYKKQLSLVHEYQADATVIENMSVKEYGMLLLTQRMGEVHTLAQHFASSDLKQRFLKMKQVRSTGWSRLTFLSFFPAIALGSALAHSMNYKILKPIHSIGESDSKGDVTSREISISPDGQWKVSNSNNETTKMIPEFPGGQQALSEFLMDNLQVAEYFKKETKEVVVRLNFDAKGKIELITYLKPIMPEMEDALSSVFRKMPNWNPPLYKNQPVRSVIDIPIKFVW